MTDGGIPLGAVGAPMSCDVCGTRLNNFEQWDGNKLTKITWNHGLVPAGVPPHEPVPVLIDPNVMPKVGYCDFCTSDKPTWAYPSSPFRMPDLKLGENHPSGLDWLGYGSGDDLWAACDECHGDIEALRWEKITNRFLAHKAVPKMGKSSLRRDAEYLHRQFRLHRIGPPFKTVPSGG